MVRPRSHASSRTHREQEYAPPNLTEDRPKVLVEGIGTPLIEDVFESLIDSEATELIVVGYEVE